MAKLNGMGSAAISSGGGLISTLLSNNAARDENQKAREYNLKLAKLQNQWNIAQWNRENLYNTPANQKQRLIEAGLNPDLMYGGGVNNMAASSPSMTAGAAATPSSLVGMPNVVGDYLDAQLKQAQIDNINANTKKQGAETSILSDDASFRKQYNEGVLRLQNVEIELKSKQGNLTDEQVKTAQATLTQISSSVEKMQAEIKQINSSTEIQQKLSDAQLKQIAASTGLTLQQTEQIAKEMPKLLRNLDDQHDINLLNVGKLTYENGILHYQAAMNGFSNSEDEADMHFADKVLKAATKITTAFRGVSLNFDNSTSNTYNKTNVLR